MMELPIPRLVALVAAATSCLLAPACDKRPQPPLPTATPPASQNASPDRADLLGTARSLHGRGNFLEAVPLYEAVLQQEPGDAFVLESLGLCQSALGEAASGVATLQRALAANPDLPVACNELAWLLATDAGLAAGGQAQEALAWAQRAVALTRNQSAEALGTLAAAWAASGDFGQADLAAGQALALARAQGKFELEAELDLQLAAYREAKPWRIERGGKTALQLVDERRRLDETVFAPELEAQQHEAVFVQLWDDLLSSGAARAFEILGQFEFDQLVFSEADGGAALAAGIPGIISHRPAVEKPMELDRDGFRRQLQQLEEAGWAIVETEWHHSAFSPQRGNSPARSQVAAVFHALHAPSETRVILRVKLEIGWRSDAGTPRAAHIVAKDYQLLQRAGKPLFAPWFSVDPRQEAAAGAPPSVLPLIVRDLDADGLPEIVLGGCNLVYRNRGGGRFEKQPFLAQPMRISPSGLVADFSGDGIDDFVAVGDGRKLHLWAGAAGGQFTGVPVACFDGRLEAAQAVSAGDVDGDGDLDLFVGQYKSPYRGGQMPSPWFDANDGYPAFLLINDGKGQFRDGIVAAGLGAKRHRRSYSASLVDFDADNDLDLVVVSDFPGLDLYLNDGSGTFSDATERLVDERHGFGMSHTFGDFDADGQLDFYMTGMGSTTARRLQGLGIEPPGREELTRMRLPMGYGNRMYLRRAERFAEPKFKDQVARTGWSWGCSSADFDNDGDDDLYVANGHISGKTTRDYCTRFWCHDIYTDESKPKFALDQLFLKELGPTQRYEASWNGYEHNALLLNHGGDGFSNIGFLAGCGFEFDSRAVVSADLDGDGRVDLLVSRQISDGQSDRHELHVLRNTLEPGAGSRRPNWIAVRIAGSAAIGAQVKVSEPGSRVRVAQLVNGDSFCSQHPQSLHFGLGTVDRVEEIEVIWPDGKSQRIADPAINQMHLLSR